MIIKSISLIPSLAYNRTRKFASFTTYTRESSSALVINIITISYLFTRYVITPLNSFSINP